MSAALAVTALLACYAVHGGLRASRRAAVRDRLGGAASVRPVRLPDPTQVCVFAAATVAGWWAASAAGAILAGAGVIATVRWRARRADRVPAIVAQERFADAVTSLSAAVRSGASLPQALGYAATEADTPVCEGLERLVADLEVGVPIEHALESWRAGAPGPDTDLVVGALEMHRRTGGDLPAVLDQVTTSIRERVSVGREVRSLTAQARLSAWILGLLPVGFFAFLWVTARGDVQGALGTSIGVVCIVLGFALEGGAILWIRSLIRVT
jgi:tight adherence protein B